MEFHPIAGLFPLMGDPELQELADDIAARGLHHPIVTHEGKILDGRNRFLACQKVGVAPQFSEWEGEGSPTAWVLSENLHRRHLTQSQKATVAAEAKPLIAEELKDRMRIGAAMTNAKLGRGEVPETPVALMPPAFEKTKARDEAAKILGVSPRYVDMAEAVKEQAPELFERVKVGDLSLAAATRSMKQQAPPSKPKPRLAPPPTRALRPDEQWPEPSEPNTPSAIILARFQGGETLAQILFAFSPDTPRQQCSAMAYQLRERLKTILHDYEIRPLTAALNGEPK